MSACANFSAYFNTFYNAMEHFDQAESIRKKSENNNISKTALDLYLSSIEKSKYILTEYPDVRFRKDAYLLIIKSHKGLSLVALHINHNYSDDSNAWKNHCIDFCNKRNIKILTFDLDLSKLKGASLENQLRNLKV